MGFISTAQLIGTFDQLLFGQESTLTISVIRILTGVLVLLETYVWQGKNKVLITPDGWFSYEYFQKSRHRFSLLYYLPPTRSSLNWVFSIQALSAFCLIIGFLPNIAAFVCFVTLASIHNRNIFVLSSGDTVYRFFCLFLTFAPIHTQLSITSYPNLLEETFGWPWVLLLIRLFVANIYLKNVLFKLLGEWWRNGTATQKVLNVRIWNRFELPENLQKKWFFKFTTYSTLVVETALFSLIWIDEFRLPLVLLGILFHLALWIFLRFGFFQLTMMVALLSFVEPDEFRIALEYITSTLFLH